MELLSLILSKKAEKRIRTGHPWIYAGDFSHTAALEMAAPGALIQVLDNRGKPLGIGTFNPHSTIACRLFGVTPETAMDTKMFYRLLEKALHRRQKLFPLPYYRLVHSEGDGLPGLVIDRFDTLLVCQVTTAGMERLKPLWLPALRELLSPQAMLFRNNLPARKKEGLPLADEIEGIAPPMPIEIPENGVNYLADLLHGQKTGWFFDQRANRALVAGYAAGKTVLDLYTHTGGFGLASAKAGATVTTLVDASAEALTLAKKAAERNRFAHCSFVQGDIFRLLPAWIGERRRYDFVIADPPAFIKDKKQVAQGLQGYRKLAKLACALVAPGGFFFIASCSHHAQPSAFRNAIEKGLKDTDLRFTLLHRSTADRDHPVHPQLPENNYLKALLYRREG